MNYWGLLLSSGVVAITGSCAPEVVIARDQPGSSAGGTVSGGAGGGTSATSGTGGNQPSGDGGDGGDGVGNEGGIPSSGSGGSGISDPPSLILADSVADFDLVQGARGWSYGFDTGTLDDFTLLPRISVIEEYKPVSGDEWPCWTTADPHWTQIFQLGAHPNGTATSPPSVEVLERAVRRWTSSYAGEIRIVGEIAKIDVIPEGSNGVDAFVLVDGLEVYSVAIDAEDAGGVSYETGGTVSVGSTVDFVLGPRDGADHHDLTRFTGVIERVIAQSD